MVVRIEEQRAAEDSGGPPEREDTGLFAASPRRSGRPDVAKEGELRARPPEILAGTGSRILVREEAGGGGGDGGIDIREKSGGATQEEVDEGRALRWLGNLRAER